VENTDQILDAPQVESIRLQYAGFWIRVGAYLLDIIILIPVNLIVGYALDDPFLEQGTASWINIGIAACYYSLMESSSYQGTLGKMALNLRVGDSDGNQLSLGNAIGRYFSKFISAILLCIGFMMVGWDEKNQGLHDKIAGTYVFYRHSK
jgi:uncharacterized RDD family membrane protein YckC